MPSVDDRIVKMEFDNAQFESGVAQTTTSLENLKKALKLEDAADNLNSISKAVGNIDVSGLNSAADTVSSRFSALGTIATGALMQIGAKAAEVGSTLLKSFTVQPLIDGFQEYETQMGAIQTIMANTADAFNDPMGDSEEHLAAVNAKLDELNTYADKTIYNFSEMTRNIGTFTAAGVDLDTATSAIQGISNLAAVSGSTSAQASTAMYQLSQALATGTVKLMDWNSVVNAGMGGKTFQNALIRTSEHLKTGANAAIKAKGSFRESLQTGWLTSEVLTTTLEQLTLATSTQEEYNNTVAELVTQGYTQEEANQIASLAKNSQDAATKVRTFTQLIDTVKEALGSGWTQSWQIIIGDFNEASNFLTTINDRISDFVGKTADARNAALQMWADAGGRQALIDIIDNSFEIVNAQIGSLARGFASVIPEDLPVRVANLMKSFAEGMQGLIWVEHAREELFQIGALLGNIVNLIAGPIATLLPAIGDAALHIFDGIMHSLLAIAGGLATALNAIIQPISLVIQHLATWIADIISHIGEFLGESVIRRIGDIIETIVHGLEGLFSKIFEGNTVLQTLSGALDAADSGLGKFLDTIFAVADQGLGMLVDGINWAIDGLFEFLKAGVDVFGGFAGFISEAFNTVFSTLREFGSGIKEVLSPVFTTIGNAFLNAWNCIVDRSGAVVDKLAPLQSGLQSLGNIAQNAFGMVASAAQKACHAFAQFINDVAPKVADVLVNNVIPAIQRFGEIAGTAFMQVAGFILQYVVPALTKFGSFTAEIFNKVKTLVGNVFQNGIIPALSDFGSNIKNVFTNNVAPAISNFVSKAGNAFSKFKQNISDFRNNTDSNFSKASDYVYAFADAIGDAFGIAQSHLKPFADALSTVANAVQNVFGKLVEIVTTTFGGIASAIAKFDFSDIPNSLINIGTAVVDAITTVIIPAIQNGFEIAKNTVFEIASNIPHVLMDIILPAIGEGLTALASGAIDLISSFIDGLFGTEAFGKTISDSVESETGGISSALSGALNGIRDAIAGAGAGLAGKISSVFGGIKDAIANVFGADWETIAERIDFVTNTVLAVSIANFIKGVGDMLTNISAIGKKLAASVNDMTQAFKQIAKAIKKFGTAAEIASFAYAIGKIVEAIQTMTDIVKNNDVGTIAAAIGIIAGILAALAGIMIAIDKFTADNPVATVGKFTNIIDGVMNALNGIGRGVKLAAIGFSIAMFGWSIKQIAGAFKELQGMNLTDMAPGLIAFGASLGALAVVMQILNKESKNSLMSALSIGVIAGSLMIIAETISKMMGLMKGDNFAQGVAAVGAILGALVGALYMLTKMPDNGGSGVLKSALSIAMLCLALRALIEPIQQLSKIPYEEMTPAVEAVIGLLGMMTLCLMQLTNATNSTDLVKSAGALAGLAVGLKTLSTAIADLATSGAGQGAIWSSMLTLAVGLGAMATALGVLAKTCSGGTLLMAAGALIMVSGAMEVLGHAIDRLANSAAGQANVWSSMLALSAGLGAMAAALGVLASICSGGKLLMAAGSILMVSAAMWVLGDAVGKLAEVNQLDAWSSLGVLAVGLGALTGALIALSAVAPMALAAGASLLIAAAAMWVVADAVEKLANSIDKFKDVGDAPKNIGETLTAIAEGLAKGKSGLDKVLSGFAVGEVCDALNQLAQTMDVWKDPELPKAAQNIGKVVSAINEGVGAGDTSGIDKFFSSLATNNVAKGLADLGASVKEYTDINDTTISNIGKVLGALNGVFTDNTSLFDILTGNGPIAKFFQSGGIKNIAEALGTLGPAVKEFTDLGEGTTGNLTAILDVLNSHLPGADTDYSLTGAQGLIDVAKGLSELAPALESYEGENVGTAAANIDTLLTSIYTNCGNLGSLFTGGAADALPTVATGLQSIAGTLDAYAGDAASNAATNIGAIFDAVYQHINPLFGLFGTGNGAAEMLQTVATGLASISTTIETYASDTASTAATNIGLVLDAIYQHISPLQGLFGMGEGAANVLVTAANGLSVLAGSLEAYTNFGTGGAEILNAVFESINTGLNGLKSWGDSGAADNLAVTAGSLLQVAGAMERFAQLDVTTLSTTFETLNTALTNFTADASNIQAVATNLDNVANSCNNLKNSASGVADSIVSISTALGTLSQTASTVGASVKGAFDAMAANMTNALTQALNTVKTTMTNIKSTIESEGSAAAEIATAKGDEIGTNFAQGISDHQGDAGTAANGLATAATDALDGHAGAAYAAGANISNSFASGLWAGVGSAQAAANALAAAAQRAIEARAQIGSPSKVAIWEGQMVGEGFAIGIGDRVSLVEKNAGKYADSALNAVYYAWQKVQRTIDDQTYYIPVTPVVDSSQLQNGMLLNGYGLNTYGSYSFGLDATADFKASNDENTFLLNAIRNDLKAYTDAVIAKDTYSLQMGDAVINDHEEIRNDFIALISDLQRRAEMDRG